MGKTFLTKRSFYIFSGIIILRGQAMLKKRKLIVFILVILFVIIAFILGSNLLYDAITSDPETENNYTPVESTDTIASPSYPDREIYNTVQDLAFRNISEEDLTYINDFVKYIYLPLEGALYDGSLSNEIKDPDHLIWTIFDQTGEIIIGYAYDTEIWDNRDKYDCTDEEFQEKYGEPVFYDNKYDSQGMINELKKVQDKISDDSFRSDFENLIQLVQKMSETHDAEYVYDAFEILHDMYYYLFNYGPELALISGEREQTMTYYGVLNVYKEKFVLEEK